MNKMLNRYLTKASFFSINKIDRYISTILLAEITGFDLEILEMNRNHNSSVIMFDIWQ